MRLAAQPETAALARVRVRRAALGRANAQPDSQHALPQNGTHVDDERVNIDAQLEQGNVANHEARFSTRGDSMSPRNQNQQGGEAEVFSSEGANTAATTQMAHNHGDV